MSKRGIGGYAGGQTCPECGRSLGIVDRFCRYCGVQLRDVQTLELLSDRPDTTTSDDSHDSDD